jgi:hypothetical protein
MRRATGNPVVNDRHQRRSMGIASQTPTRSRNAVRPPAYTANLLSQRAEFRQCGSIRRLGLFGFLSVSHIPSPTNSS